MTRMLTETVYVDRDLLCEQSENMFGRPDCGPVYKRSDAAGKGYTYVNSGKVFHFVGQIGSRVSGLIDRVPVRLINFQLGLDDRPVGIGLRHKILRVVGESGRIAGVVDQVELAVDDLERFRIDIDRNRSGAATSPAQ